MKNNLPSYKPKGIQHWEQVSYLHEQAEKAVTQLQVLGAEASIRDDFELVSALVAKLATDYKEDWDKFCMVHKTSQQSIWEKFRACLNEIHERATNTKLRTVAAAPVKIEVNGFPSKCPTCKTLHKRGTKCPGRFPDVPVSVISNLTPLKKIKNREELKSYIAEAKKMTGNCKKPQLWKGQGKMQHPLSQI